jgi:hypothetical protein
MVPGYAERPSSATAAERELKMQQRLSNFIKWFNCQAGRLFAAAPLLDGVFMPVMNLRPHREGEALLTMCRAISDATAEQATPPTLPRG